jgi:hypothetical protein
MASLAQDLRASRKQSLSWVLVPVAACAVIAAIVQSLLVPLDCDVSWLITVNEKVLSGQRLYVDIIEPNPPASVWLYTPEVWLAQQLAVRPEAMVATAFLAAALVTCAAVAKISARLAAPPPRATLLAATSFVTMVLPVGTFAQREHAALLLALPVLTGVAVLAERRALPRSWRLALGVAAGLVIVIKPHFALAIVPAAAFALWRSRRFAPLVAPAIAAACTVAAYGAALFVFARAYLDLVPMLTEVYLPLREQWLTVLAGPVIVVPVTTGALVWALRPARLPALPIMLLIGSAGFACAGLVQMKGYLNHALPGIALGFVALLVSAPLPEVDRARAKAVLAAAGLLAGMQLYAMASIRPPAGLKEAVERVAPPHPTVVTLGPDLLTGHPVVRNVGGTWVGSRPALFIVAGARRALATAPKTKRARLQGWYEADLHAFATDLSSRHPDVVLVDARPGVAWLREEPVIRAAMANYRPAARANDVEIWIRRQ